MSALVTREFEFRSESVGDGRTLEGIVSTFNDFTMITDSKGQFREQVAPAAFNKTLREGTPKLMFNHGQHPMIGDMPIGVITELKPRTAGLYVRATLSDNWLVSPVRDAIANGSISGMSFRFNVVRDDWAVGKDGVPERTLKEINVPEVSAVVFPAYKNTTVSVRSQRLLASFADPRTRAEVARALVYGTPRPRGAKPPWERSRSRSQNRALLILAGVE